MPWNEGSYGVKIPWNKGTFTENVVHEPTFMAYELRLLWHTNPPFYAIWTVFIGGGGGHKVTKLLLSLDGH